MKSYLYKTSLLVGLALSVVACEKVIDIPLEEADQRIVVEGVLRDQPGNNYVLLSKTGTVYSQNNFEKISGAVVTVTDQSGAVFTLTEVSGEPGKYTHPTLEVLADNWYDLKVIVSADTFTASSQTFFKPQIDSLTYLQQAGSFGPSTDTTYLVFFSFVDNGNQDNYYRISAWVNGAKDGNIYITNDDLFNGQNYTQPLFATTIEKGDTVLVELQAIDAANYTYFFSLSNASSDGGPFAASPGNPVSNLEGGAVGYFGAYTTDTMTIIMPQ